MPNRGSVYFLGTSMTCRILEKVIITQQAIIINNRIRWLIITI